MSNHPRTRQPVTAPYTFVPLSPFVFAYDPERAGDARSADVTIEPEWGARVSHDIPFTDGLSGHFDITIEAKSQICIGGPRSKDGDNVQVVSPYQIPDGRYAIPSRTLKGMVRNILEIAAFGRMQHVDDRRFGIRDLSKAAAPYYRNRIQEVKAGWLSFGAHASKSGWSIETCEWAQIAFSELMKLDPTARSWLANKSDSPSRLEKWTKNNTLTQELMVASKPRARRGTASARQAYVHKDGPGLMRRKGSLVFTGNTGQTFRPKAHEFFFSLEGPSTVQEVPTSVFEAFRDVHAPADGREANPGWEYWRQRHTADSKLRIPVFYIEEKGDPGKTKISSMGLARMFKLAHKLSVHQMQANSGSAHRNEELLDLPTLLFGCEAEERRLKGRVHFGIAACSDHRNPPPALLEELPAVLLGPKPSYFPCYVRQPGSLEGKSQLPDSRREYATYTPLDDTRYGQVWSKPEIRGWKRYPVRHRSAASKLQENQNVALKLKPLNPSTIFKGRVRFHNLRPVELGALLWVLEWGGKINLRHSMGLGKPLGLGQVSISVDGANWQLVANRPGTELMNKGHYIDCFVARMSKAYATYFGKDASWDKSPQILTLLATANPDYAETWQSQNGTLAYMELAAFQNAKNAARFLPEYVVTPQHVRLNGRYPEETGSTRPQVPERINKLGRRDHGAPFSANFRFRRGQKVSNADGEIATVSENVPYTATEMLVEFEDGSIEPVRPGDFALNQE